MNEGLNMLLRKSWRNPAKQLSIVLWLLYGGAASATEEAQPTLQEAPFVRDGRAGFVVSAFSYGLAPDAAETGACPNGMSKSMEEIFAQNPGGKQRANESDKAYIDRLRAGARRLATNDAEENVCMHPENFPADPHFRTVEGEDLSVYGIDLDGRNSEEDFTGMSGETGVDNQYYRAMGCVRSYQSSGQSNGFDVEMLTGSWGILVTLEDVDSIENDDQVTVGIYANADPIRLSPSREPLSYATYAMSQETERQAETSGRIVDGRLMTEPFDVDFVSVVNSMVLDRVLRDARIEATLSAEGVLEGYMSGFSPVKAIYDQDFGFRNATRNGGPTNGLNVRSANGKANVLGYTCHGVYQALHKLADGHPDPETGEFTSISIQYRFTAIPAFVVDKQTGSVSASLSGKQEHSDDY